MTVYEYRTRLMAELADYDAVEVVNAANYYAELIEDAEDPEEQMNRLGPPEQLAQMIIESGGWENTRRKVYEQPYEAHENGMSAGRIAALVLTFPLWLTVYILIITLFIVQIAMMVGLPIGIVAVVINGFINFGSPMGMVFMFVAVLLMGLFLMVMSAGKAIAGNTGSLFSKFSHFLFGKKNNEEGIFNSEKPKTAVNKAALAIGAVMLCVGVVGTAVTGSRYEENADAVTNFDSEVFDVAINGSFDTVDLDIGVGDLTIERSTDDRAVLRCKNVDRNELDVDDSDNLRIMYSSGEKWLTYNVDTEFVLSLPERRYKSVILNLSLGELVVQDMTAESVTLTNNLGKTSVVNCVVSDLNVDNSLGELNIEDVEADTANIKCASGKIAVTHSNITRSGIDSDLGAVTLTDVTGNDLKVDCDSGETSLTGCVFATVDVDSDMDDIKLTDCDLGPSRLKASSGKIEVSNTSQNGVFSIESNLGNVLFESSMIDKLEAGIDSGNLEMTAVQITTGADINIDFGNADVELVDGSYDVRATTDLGKVKVNGEDASNAPRGTIPFVIHTDSGKIDIVVS